MTRVCRSQPCHRPQSRLKVQQRPVRNCQDGGGGDGTPDLGARQHPATPYLCLPMVGPDEGDGETEAWGKQDTAAAAIPVPGSVPANSWPNPHGSRHGVTAREGDTGAVGATVPMNGA